MHVCGLGLEGLQAPAVTQMLLKSSLKKGGRETLLRVANSCFPASFQIG